jgi:hypothetical protein
MSDINGYEPNSPKSTGWADRLTERADIRRDEIEHEVCS